MTAVCSLVVICLCFISHTFRENPTITIPVFATHIWINGQITSKSFGYLPGESQLCGHAQAHTSCFVSSCPGLFGEVAADVLPSQEVQDGVQTAVGTGKRSSHLIGYIDGL